MDSNTDSRNDIVSSRSPLIIPVQSDSIDNMNKGYSQDNLDIAAENQHSAPKIPEEESHANMLHFIEDRESGNFAKSETPEEESRVSGWNPAIAPSYYQDSLNKATLNKNEDYSNDTIRIAVHNQVVKKKKDRLSQDELKDLDSILAKSYCNLNEDSVQDNQTSEHNNLINPPGLRDEVSQEALIDKASKPNQRVKKDTSSLILEKKPQVEGSLEKDFSSFSEQIIQSLQGSDDHQISCIQQNGGSPTSQEVLGGLEPYRSTLRSQITDMVMYFVKKLGLADAEEMKRKQCEYAQNSALFQIFEILQRKYRASGKSREDMARFNLRKAIAFTRDNLRRKLNLDTKQASILLANTYFQDEWISLSREKPSMSEEILELLPFPKNNIPKRLSRAMVSKLFSFEAFRRDYKVYLDEFDKTIDLENQRKIRRMINFLVSCVKQDQIVKFESYLHLPWIDVWIKSAKIIAKEMLSSEFWENIAISISFPSTSSSRYSRWSIMDDLDALEVRTSELDDSEELQEFEE